jgi:hypothetical protein
MNWKGYGRKWAWPNLRYYPGICLEGLRKATKNASQNNRSAGRDLNPGPPVYEAEVLIIRLRRSINNNEKNNCWYIIGARNYRANNNNRKNYIILLNNCSSFLIEVLVYFV